MGSEVVHRYIFVSRHVVYLVLVRVVDVSGRGVAFVIVWLCGVCLLCA